MRIGAGVVALLVLVSGGSLVAQQSKKKTPPPPNSAHPVKDIMEKTHKEKGALIFLVRDAESTDADNKALLEVYKQLATLKPPTGDAKGWANRVNNVIAALQDLIDKKPNAVEKVRNVTDCKGCHDAHRVGGNSGK
ncbi:MAG: hypothetical protein JO332_03890 [Planctomycetaceae bacterium]|nr:hypothetical protein [Planctomycetaceae bacterium]